MKDVVARSKEMATLGIRVAISAITALTNCMVRVDTNGLKLDTGRCNNWAGDNIRRNM